MSATARAAGNPAGDRPGRRTPPPPPLTAVRLAPRASAGPPAAVERPTTGERPAPAAGTARSAGPAPARPVRAHTAPVRAGALRRPVARAPQPTGPVARTAGGSPASRVRSAMGAHRAPVVLLIVTLLVATTLGLLFLNTAIAVNSLKATQLAAANEDRAQEVQRLERQVIAGGTPAELAAEAREAGMVPAGAAAYLVIGEDGTVTLRGEPVPAEGPEPAGDPAAPAAGGED